MTGFYGKTFSSAFTLECSDARMAQSNFETHQYSSTQYVESCGAVLFDLSDQQDKKVCLLRSVDKEEWLLAKGRRNIGESRGDAALREVLEETGFRSRLLPLKMTTRATPFAEPEDLPDEPRQYLNLVEPFMLSIRKIGGQGNVKLIWWFIATLDNDDHPQCADAADLFKPSFFPCSEAIERLTFQNDREILQKAIDLVAVNGL